MLGEAHTHARVIIGDARAILGDAHADVLAILGDAHAQVRAILDDAHAQVHAILDEARARVILGNAHDHRVIIEVHDRLVVIVLDAQNLVHPPNTPTTPQPLKRRKTVLPPPVSIS